MRADNCQGLRQLLLDVIRNGTHEVEDVLLDELPVLLGHGLKLAGVGVIVLTPGCPAFADEVLEGDGSGLSDGDVGFRGARGVHFDDVEEEHGATGLVVQVLQEGFRFLTLLWVGVVRGREGGREGGRVVRNAVQDSRQKGRRVRRGRKRNLPVMNKGRLLLSA